MHTAETELLVAVPASGIRKPKHFKPNHTKRNIGVIAGLLVIAFVIAGFATGRFNLREINAANLFPASTTFFTALNPYAISLENATNDVNSVLSALPDSKDPKKWAFLQKLSSQESALIENHKKYSDWLGIQFASAQWDGNAPAYAYNLFDTGKAEKFLQTEDCKTSFLAEYCSPDTHRIVNGWLIVSTPETMKKYNLDSKDVLGKTDAFLKQTEGSQKSPIILAVLPAAELSATLPTAFQEFSATKGTAMFAVNPMPTGVNVKLRLSDTDNAYVKVAKHEALDVKTIKDLPDSTVMGIAVSNAGEYVPVMKSLTNSFMNTHDEWKTLSDSLAKWGLVSKEDMAKVFGKTTTISLNKGSTGNRVAGTFTAYGADSDKIITILSNAAKENPSIPNAYKVTNDNGTITIASHDPIIENKIGGTLDTKSLFGDTTNSIALAYLDVDGTKSLLDSSFKPNVQSPAPTVGFNLSFVNDQTIELNVNVIK